MKASPLIGYYLSAFKHLKECLYGGPRPMRWLEVAWGVRNSPGYSEGVLDCLKATGFTLEEACARALFGTPNEDRDLFFGIHGVSIEKAYADACASIRRAWAVRGDV